MSVEIVCRKELGILAEMSLEIKCRNDSVIIENDGKN